MMNTNKTKGPRGPVYHRVRQLVRDNKLNTAWSYCIGKKVIIRNNMSCCSNICPFYLVANKDGVNYFYGCQRHSYHNLFRSLR